MGANNSKNEGDLSTSQIKETHPDRKKARPEKASREGVHDTQPTAVMVQARDIPKVPETAAAVNQTAPLIDPARPDTLSQKSDTISKMSDINAYRMDFNSNPVATLKWSKTSETHKPRENKTESQSDSVNKKIKAAEDALIKKVDEGYVKRIDYIELAEHVKMLSETLRELNDRITVLEKEKNKPVPLKENVNFNAFDDAFQMNDRQASSEDLINKMKEQLKKRKPDPSVLEKMRRNYKEYKANVQQSSNGRNEN